ncbi:hypothetical protein [Luteimonas cucumeris]|uniref:hypothetical protein n=1 Tax=Luteimonas cucumeris TaxID=985012 RepID=UPI0011A6FDDC|nr:hypothetical protein [Luteimonas cucumeris]
MVDQKDTRVRTREQVVVVVVIVVAAANALPRDGNGTKRAMAGAACMRQQYRTMVRCVKGIR